MTLVRREKISWTDAGEQIGAEHSIKKQKITVERQKIMEENRLAADRSRKLAQAMSKAKEGEERKKFREEQETKSAAKKLYDKMRKEKTENKASVVLARVYRGHLGRKAARRWAMKKAELEAMNALMQASAITIQRVARGHWGRMVASDVRMEMAEFIAQIRQDEALADEEEFWRTHTVARFKRDMKAFVTHIGEAAKKAKDKMKRGNDDDDDDNNL